MFFKNTKIVSYRAKIRNIEATEDAKLRLIRNRLNKKDGPSQFVPTNMAVNFVQHNRCEPFIVINTPNNSFCD